MIDLHAHTTASDGTCTPTELVQVAHQAGLKAVAVTDHDTVDGVAEAMAEGKRLGVEVVPAVEISIDYKGPKVNGRSGWMHLLVYDLQLDGPLARELRELQLWRAQRNDRIIAKLNELGLAITLEDVRAVSGGGQIGRPHFATAMLEKGYIKERQEAFDKYLAKGAPAYEDKRRLSIEDSLKKARAEGATPVLAHPFSLGLDEAGLKQQLSQWKALGLQGVEVIYPEQDAAFRSELSRVAVELELIQTGGSDFHGDNKPTIQLGSGIDGNVQVPDGVLDSLRICKGL